ncbi:hypothetical protein OSB04_013801 [Centaurea solstitialis]|uniref:Thioredoxin domain-containing protein n=1 Tax=Centaurea solstitialis TaxID=347529 RepID=A0AA38WFU0_9ASTR|nr:hypothetical protein OSB04_013801 [Centaurea solstitialis]
MEATKTINRHNLTTATSDEHLKDIFHQIRTSKSPAVINFGASWYVKLLANSLNLYHHSVEFVYLGIGIVKLKLHTRCRVCGEILPSFNKLSNKFPKLSFVYADIDECPETTQHIRYTPTFHFYRDGERVDAMFGAGEERLHDRLWLHS